VKRRQFEIDGKQFLLQYHDDKEPFQWQVAAFKQLVPLDFAAIFAEVGCGKSAELIYLVCAHFLAHEIDAMLLLAPKSVYRQWATQQLPEHCTVPYDVFVWGEHSTKKSIEMLQAFTKLKTDKLKIVLANVEAFSYKTYVEYFKRYIKENKTAFVVDEATVIKTPDAQRTQNICIYLNDYLMYRGRINSVVNAAKKRYILTGTPVDGSPVSVYSMFNFLQWGFFKSTYTVFRQTYSMLRKEKTGNDRTYFRNLSRKDMANIRREAAKGAPNSVLAFAFNTTEEDIAYIIEHPSLTLPWKNLSKLKREIAPYSYTITLDECFADAPEEQDVTLEVTMSEEQAKVYASLKKILYVELGGRSMTVQNKLTLSMRLQQVTGGFIPLQAMDGSDDAKLQAIPGPNAKYNVLKEDLEDNSPRPVIVFCRYVAEAEFVAKKLAEDFEEDVGLIVGRVPQGEREDILKRFDTGDLPFLVATPGCLSRGRNLQVSHIIYFFSLSFSSEEHLQARGRIRRATQKSACIYKYLTMVKTIDEHVVEVLRDKQDLLVYMQDADIGELI